MKMNVLRFVVFSACSLFIFSPFGHAQFNITMQANHTFSESMNDVWGYEVNGAEYALALTNNGTYIINVTIAASPVEEVFIDGPNSGWRDAKTWGTYAYITNENNGGMQIIDLGALPGGTIDPATDVYSYTGGPWANGTVNFSSAHNVYIDENGICYIIGADYGVGGCIMVDLTADPINPPIVGIYNQRYVHDAFARGDTLWTGEINNGIFSIVDVSDKANPVVLGTQSTPNNFTHNVWLSDDGKTAFTTDEVGGAVIGAYDITDPTDIKFLSSFQSSPGQGVIEHNVFVKDDFLVISYYRDGVVIVDAHKPEKMIEMGNYDTSPLSGGGFNGCWGVYPYLPSGNILASDIEQGLFILTPSYTEACFLEGDVTDANTTNPINDVAIIITEDETANTTTGFSGDYVTGVPASGTYTVTYFKSGYVSQTLTQSLSNGTTEILNVALVPSVPFTLTGQITDADTGTGIPLAEVLVDNGFDTYTAMCDASGNFSIALPGQGNYDIYAGKWGYISGVNVQQYFDEFTNTSNLALQVGYYDDFLFDFGWVENGSSSTGRWERGVPNGTSHNGNFSNANVDVDGDLGAVCYVTGNTEGGSAGTDDVDNGSTFLTSPMFDLTGYNEPQITYSRWWYNSGGNTTPDDTLLVRINNGIEIVTVETIVNGDAYEGQWHENTITVSDHITPTANMQMLLDIGDLNDPHLVEGGLDFFSVADYFPPVNVQIQVWLQGPYDAVNGLMTTELLINDLVPNSQPYDRSPWNYQGGENLTTIPADVVDWVLVEVRDLNDNNSILESRAALLRSDGIIKDLDGSDGVTFYALPSNADYYLVVRHRNHLAIMSNQPVTLPNATALDFTNPVNVSGTDQVVNMGNGEYGMRAGDMDSDGILAVADFNLYQSQTALINSYIDGDCNLDRNVTVADFNAYLPNSSFIGVSQVRY